MYRNDHEAAQQLADAATREANHLREENEAIRAAIGRVPPGVADIAAALPPNGAYTIDVRLLPAEARAQLAMHTVRPFPVWAVAK
jgi:hypothetical protein